MPIYVMVKKKKIKNTFFFYKTKNCSNGDPSISCNEGLEKCCITSAYLLFHSGERAMACGPIVLNFPESRMTYFMQIASKRDNLHEMSKPITVNVLKYVTPKCLTK